MIEQKTIQMIEPELPWSKKKKNQLRWMIPFDCI